MANEAIINNARSKGARIQDLAKKAIDALTEIRTIGINRENGGLDFTAIDYEKDPMFGHLDSSTLNKSIDQANDLLSNMGLLYKIIR